MMAVAHSSSRATSMTLDDDEQNKQGQLRVVKIYDPLYYNYCEGCDVTYIAEQDYANEVAAYEKMREMDIDGALRPCYSTVKCGRSAWSCPSTFSI